MIVSRRTLISIPTSEKGLRRPLHTSVPLGLRLTGQWFQSRRNFGDAPIFRIIFKRDPCPDMTTDDETPFSFRCFTLPQSRNDETNYLETIKQIERALKP